MEQIRYEDLDILWQAYSEVPQEEIDAAVIEAVAEEIETEAGQWNRHNRQSGLRFCMRRGCC